MPGGGSKTTGTQTTTQSLNPAFEPIVNNVLGKIQGQIDNPFAAYPKTTVAPFSNQTQTALQGMQNVATAGDPLGNTAYQNANSLIGSQGMTPGVMQSLLPLHNISRGNISVDPSRLQGIYGAMNQVDPATTYMRGAASGTALPGLANMQNLVQTQAGRAAGETTPLIQGALAGAMNPGDRYGLEKTASGDMLNGNPYFKSVLEAQQGDLRDQVNRNFSTSGRYGSGMHTGVLTEELGRLGNEAMMQNYAMERGLQDRAQQFLTQDDRVGFDQTLAGTGQLAGILNQNYQNLLGGEQSLFNNQMANLNTAMGAGQQIFNNQMGQLGQLGGIAGQLSNLDATNIANMGGASGQMANQYRSGINDAMGTMSMAPSLYQNMNAPWQNLLGVGQQYDQQAQNLTNDAISRYYFNQNQGREPIDWAAGILNGIPGAGLGQTMTTQQRPSGGVQGLLGGALSGATLGSTFGPWGTGIGGALGGLAGLF